VPLGEEEPIGGARDGDPEEVVEVAEVCHGELRVQTLGDALQESWSRGRQDDVVDVEEQVHRGAPLLKHKEGGVGRRSGKAKLSEIGGEPLVPCARGLLKTIEKSL